MKVTLSPQASALLEEARLLAAAGRREAVIPIYRALAFGAEGDDIAPAFREDIIGVLIQALRAADDAPGAIDAFIQALPGLVACDAAFDRSYVAGLRASNASPHPFQRRERLYQLTNYLHGTAGVAGDVVECGTGSGLSSFVICSALRLESPGFAGEGYRVFDSFAGLSEPQPGDDIPAGHPDAARLRKLMHPGNFGSPLAHLKQVLSAFPAVSYHPGWIPASLQSQPERLYRLVHIDVDLYAPTLGALEYFYPRLADGGMIVSDDFNWPGCERAMREFCDAAGVDLDINTHGQASMTAPC